MSTWVAVQVFVDKNVSIRIPGVKGSSLRAQRPSASTKIRDNSMSPSARYPSYPTGNDPFRSLAKRDRTTEEEPDLDRQNSERGVSRSFSADKMAGTEVEEPKAENTELTSSVCAVVPVFVPNPPLRILSRITRRSSGNAKPVQRDDAKSCDRFVSWVNRHIRTHLPYVRRCVLPQQVSLASA